MTQQKKPGQEGKPKPGAKPPAKPAPKPGGPPGMGALRKPGMKPKLPPVTADQLVSIFKKRAELTKKNREFNVEGKEIVHVEDKQEVSALQDSRAGDDWFGKKD